MSEQPIESADLFAAFNSRYAHRFGSVTCRALQLLRTGDRFELLVSSDQKSLLALQTAPGHAYLRDLFAEVDLAAAENPAVRGLRLLFLQQTDRGELDVFELSQFAPNESV